MTFMSFSYLIGLIDCEIIGIICIPCVESQLSDKNMEIYRLIGCNSNSFRESVISIVIGFIFLSILFYICGCLCICYDNIRINRRISQNLDDDLIIKDEEIPNSVQLN